MSLAAAPGNATRIYAGTSRGSVYRSDDAGRSWVFLSRLSASVLDFQIDPNLAGTVYALVSSTPERQQQGISIIGSLFRSDDEGETWEKLADATAIAIDPQQGGTIYRGLDLGAVFKSTDAGRNWSEVSPLFSQTKSVIVDSSRPDIFYAFFGSVLYRTTDGGAHWSLVGSMLPGDFRLQIAGRDGPGSLFAVSQGSVYRSTNGGQTWTTASLPNALTIFQLTGIPTAGGALFVATDRGVFRSDDLGGTWIGGDFFSGYPVHAVATAQPSLVYAGTYKGGDGFFRSEDGGSHWSISNDGLLDAAASAMTTDPRSPSRIYVGGTGVFRSDNFGVTWTTLEQHLRPSALALDRSRPERLYAVSGGHVWASRDSGATWAQSPGPPVQVQSLLVDAGGILFTGGFKSPDAGDDWFPTNGQAFPVAADPSAPGVLYGVAAGPVGFSSDVFKTVDGAFSWQGPLLKTDLLEYVVDIAVGAGPVVYAATLFQERFILIGSVSVSRDQGNTWNKVLSKDGAVRAIAPDPVRQGVLYVSMSSGLYRLPAGSAILLGRQGPSPIKLAVAPDGSRLYGIMADQELAMILVGSSASTPRIVPFRQPK
jgi:photosystem II stability/assembly factor-like uncharacterized protein